MFGEFLKSILFLNFISFYALFITMIVTQILHNDYRTVLDVFKVTVFVHILLLLREYIRAVNKEKKSHYRQLMLIEILLLVFLLLVSEEVKASWVVFLSVFLFFLVI